MSLAAMAAVLSVSVIFSIMGAYSYKSCQAVKPVWSMALTKTKGRHYYGNSGNVQIRQSKNVCTGPLNEFHIRSGCFFSSDGHRSVYKDNDIKPSRYQTRGGPGRATLMTTSTRVFCFFFKLKKKPRHSQLVSYPPYQPSPHSDEMSARPAEEQAGARGRFYDELLTCGSS